MTTMTVDEMAMRIMIFAPESTRQAQLDALSAEICGESCSECGCVDVDSNDEASLAHRTYLCNGCGRQWDAT